MTDVHVYVADQFSKYPSGRTRNDSRFSGDEFREKFLVPPISEKKKLYVHLDGVLGYGSSFLDQAFGGLRRIEGIALEDLENSLHIMTKYPDLEYEIWSYIRGK